jgi:hypothetical protein
MKITVRWDPERAARLVQQGDEVSEVLWLDDRTTQCLSNTDIEFPNAAEAEDQALPR